MAAELQLQPPRLATAHNTQPPPTNNLGPNFGPKRHRRPSVRLGDIGDQPATHRTSKPWRLNPHSSPSPNKSSKTRPLTNLVTPINGNFDTTTTNNGNNSQPNFSKSNKVNKKARTNFNFDQPQEEDQQLLLVDDVDDDEERENTVNNHDYNYEDDGEEGFRDFDPEIDGPDPEESPVHSLDDDGVHLDMWNAHNRRSIRATRVSNSNNELGFESNSRNQGTRLDDGVRKWLLGLGLARYAPVFEIHEVDDEVLPYLTFDDLKDMGINAVGTRRKLYSDILKLRKGLS